MDASQAQQVLNKLQQLCSRQEKCTADIIDYFYKHKVPSEFHKTILTRLKDDKFIDEKRYASAVVKDKFRLNRWGKIKIRYFLISKKIPVIIIDDAIGSIDDTEYRNTVSGELRKKALSFQGKEPEVVLLKLIQFAASRGYEEEMVREIWNQKHY